LRKADRLVVMDRGQVVETGNHDELMTREGHYYRLYQAQARNVDTEMIERRLPTEERTHAVL
jgi:ATP-binding cassette subfamily B protein